MTSRATLRERFLAALDDEAEAVHAADPELEAWLDDALAKAHETWGTLGDDDVFLRHLASKVSATRPLRGTRTADLYLAAACLGREARALEAFERHFLSKVERALVRVGIERSMAPDLVAALREDVLFGRAGSTPLLEDYTGRGDLSSWLRSIAVRMAFKAKKRESRNVEPPKALEGLVAEDNPELLILMRAHAVAFDEAVTQAIEALDVRARNLLRQHYVDGLNLDELGRLYQVHRATAARWIVDARESVLARIKKELGARMTPSELESFLRMARANLGARISTVIRVIR